MTDLDLSAIATYLKDILGQTAPGKPRRGASKEAVNAPGKCEVQAITQVIGSRSYSSPERHASKKVLILSTRADHASTACNPRDTP
jgi:hypothetical protein